MIPRCRKTRDQTVRTVELQIEEDHDLDVREKWHRSKARRVIRVQRTRIGIIDGQIATIDLSGPLLLTDGTPGLVVVSRTYGGKLRPLGQTPPWAYALANAVLRGEV